MVAPAKPVAVAYVNPQNAPIFLKRFDDGAHGMDLMFVINGALDVFDEAIASTSGRRSGRKSYLGLLNLIDGFAVYGYLSNTLIKTIVVLDAEPNSFAVPSDTAVETFLRRLYFAYVETISNPFFEGFQFDESESYAVSTAGNESAESNIKYPELQKAFQDCIVKLVEQSVLT